MFHKNPVESLDKIYEETTYNPSDKLADSFDLKSIITRLPKDDTRTFITQICKRASC